MFKLAIKSATNMINLKSKSGINKIMFTYLIGNIIKQQNMKPYAILNTGIQIKFAKKSKYCNLPKVICHERHNSNLSAKS